MRGATIAFITGFAFIFLSDMTGNLFAQRPYELPWITGGFSAQSLVVAGIILGAWRKYRTE